MQYAVCALYAIQQQLVGWSEGTFWTAAIARNVFGWALALQPQVRDNT